ncbi:MAG: hypothetical protein U0837_09425 [Dehalococcoidia bacterium]
MTETRAIGEILRDAAAGNLAHVLAEERAGYDPVGSAERLFALLDRRGIAYVLVGGIAMLQYVAGRNTEDIDLIVAPSAVRLVPELQVLSLDKDFGRASFEGIQVDLLFTANKLFDSVRARHAQTLTFGSTRVVTATPEGLLLLKLFALPSLYRQGNTHRASIYESDIAGLLALGEADLDSVWSQLRPHLLDSDIDELRKIVSEIEARKSRFGRNPE